MRSFALGAECTIKSTAKGRDLEGLIIVPRSTYNSGNTTRTRARSLLPLKAGKQTREEDGRDHDMRDVNVCFYAIPQLQYQERPEAIEALDRMNSFNIDNIILLQDHSKSWRTGCIIDFECAMTDVPRREIIHGKRAVSV